MASYGYIRVSARDQNEDRQWIAMRELDIPKENIFTDKQSGSDFDRPEYQSMAQRLKKDDLLYIKSIDRLGRNYKEILEQWRIITKEIEADIVVMDMPLLDTRTGKDLMGTFLSDIVLQVLSFVAENERSNIRQRQAEGIAAAKERGVKFGRPSRTLPKKFYEVYEAWRNGTMSVRQASKACGVPTGTFYDRAKAMRLKDAQEESDAAAAGKVAGETTAEEKAIPEAGDAKANSAGKGKKGKKGKPRAAKEKASALEGQLTLDLGEITQKIPPQSVCGRE